jgi:hypothetical protein
MKTVTMKKFLLNLLAACIFISGTAVIPASSAFAFMPKKSGSFKSTHFGKKDHMKFKKVKKKKARLTKSTTHPERKLQRYDKKKMHSGDTRSYLFGIPIKKKGFKQQNWDR